MPGSKYRFPAWPITRVLNEASLAWDLRNPDDLCDPLKCEWKKLCEIVHAFLRHSLCDYDSIVTSENRDQLHDEIRSAAKVAYPWLRRDFDPRKEVSRTCNDKPMFDAISAELATLYTTRQGILVRLNQFKRNLSKSETEIIDLQSKLERVSRLIATKTSQCETLLGLSKTTETWLEKGRSLMLTHHERRGYLFAGQIVPIYSTFSMEYRCPRCRALVRRSRKPVPVGGGIKLHGISCCCLSTVLPDRYNWPSPDSWQRFIEMDEKRCQNEPVGNLEP